MSGRAFIFYFDLEGPALWQAKLVEIAMRIRELREILEITPEQAAQATNTSVEEYLSCESGQKDFSFTFLYQRAKLFGVDMVELVTGENPRLSFYSIVRKDEGLPIKRRAGFNYQHLAYLFEKQNLRAIPRHCTLFRIRTGPADPPVIP